MITTLFLFFLTLFSLFALQWHYLPPAPGVLANAPASLLGRTYSYIARDGHSHCAALENREGGSS